MMAETIGFSVISVRCSTFGAPRAPATSGSQLLSNDSRFVDKLRDVVDLYVRPRTPSMKSARFRLSISLNLTFP